MSRKEVRCVRGTRRVSNVMGVIGDNGYIAKKAWEKISNKGHELYTIEVNGKRLDVLQELVMVLEGDESSTSECAVSCAAELGADFILNEILNKDANLNFLGRLEARGRNVELMLKSESDTMSISKYILYEIMTILEPKKALSTLWVIKDKIMDILVNLKDLPEERTLGLFGYQTISVAIGCYWLVDSGVSKSLPAEQSKLLAPFDTWEKCKSEIIKYCGKVGEDYCRYAEGEITIDEHSDLVVTKYSSFETWFVCDLYLYRAAVGLKGPTATLEDLGLEGDKLDAIRKMISSFLKENREFEISRCEQMWLSLYAFLARGDIDKNKKKIKAVQEENERLTARNAKLSDEKKGLKTQIKQLYRECSELRGKLSLSNSKLQSIESNGVEDSSQFVGKISKLEEEIARVKEEYTVDTVELDRLKRAVQSRDDKMTKMEEQLVESAAEVDKLRESMRKNESEEEGSQNEASIAAMVRALEKQKYIILGGAWIHSKLREAGLQGKMIEETNKLFDKEAVLNADKVFVFTACIGHTLVERVKSILGPDRSRSGDILYINGKGTYRVVTEIFNGMFGA